MATRDATRPEMRRDDAIAAHALLAGLTELSSRSRHDLLGPLNRSASLLTLFIRRYRGQLDQEADKLLEFLESASASMEGVAEGVRRYMEIAARAPGFGPVDLNVSLASSLAQLQKTISTSCAVIVSDSLPTVWADAAHMKALFEILLENSIKFALPDVPARIQVSSRPAGDSRMIAIADNGIGIDPQHRDAAFLPFKRLNGAEYPGAGLGLAAARLIAEMHGGTIRIIDSPTDAERTSRGIQVEFTVSATEPQ